ncbi:MAG: hypothetical protein K2X56_05465 [Mycobacterium pseudokansasii]|uniref:Uncharacterized protein n=1 Tax=Mycobacterium pseudokansasii TaxID=2341080 RepID=A0A498QW89_9MYCO|nr:hypothetical protein [Mycobacterium pseudokansasii]MBY0387553.1 hypothetical protein [Mycobacterium pseudokansasii]VAZ99575.1 hypothetical protein LAUMK35_04382 [Mycobacterium pseudokansasii]VBA30763.1 hypothetical protein LAUMK21_04375 [Mycobacterium pseudokansasii]VBA53755.1 hypothetical protein LAUMK142_04275 [Mycobacterium pseudokansasii]
MSQPRNIPTPTGDVSGSIEEFRSGAASGSAVLDGRWGQALTFEAPYVLDRLLSEGVVDTREQAQELFSETKKYLILCELNPDTAIGMYSGLVDAAWHAFILFTAAYIEYGQRFFGRYLAHTPAVVESGPSVGAGDRRGRLREKSTFLDFRRRYETLFQHALPDVWYDERCISPSRRMIREDRVGPLSLTHHDGCVELCRPDGTSLVSVNELAYPALQFILATSVFYVRELPGGLTEEEKVGLSQALARCGALRIVA